MSVSFCFFFFQAEDGIRDGHVTGVQTCALPISPTWSGACSSATRSRPSIRVESASSSRSEERRVGKECRSRWSPDHSKKTKGGKADSVDPGRYENSADADRRDGLLP